MTVPDHYDALHALCPQGTLEVSTRRAELRVGRRVRLLPPMLPALGVGMGLGRSLQGQAAANQAREAAVTAASTAAAASTTVHRAYATAAIFHDPRRQVGRGSNAWLRRMASFWQR